MTSDLRLSGTDTAYDVLREQEKGQRSASAELEEASLGTALSLSLSIMMTFISSGATFLLFFSDSTQALLTNLWVMKTVMVLR